MPKKLLTLSRVRPDVPRIASAEGRICLLLSGQRQGHPSRLTLVKWAGPAARVGPIMVREANALSDRTASAARRRELPAEAETPLFFAFSKGVIEFSHQSFNPP
jgi:hypothetical protein